MYQKLNNLLFEGLLPDALVYHFNPDLLMYIRLGIDVEIDGLCTWDGPNWVIGIDSNLSPVDKLYTLVHEMIHIWQHTTGRKMNHGKAFQKKCLEFIEEYAL